MNIFAILFWLGLILQVIIRSPFDRAQRKEKKIIQLKTKLENILLVMLTLGGLVLPFIYSFTNLIVFANFSLPTWSQWFGAFLLASGILFFWRSHLDLGINWSPSLEIREKHNLVTHGIYKRIRHPMYTSLWIMSLAQPLLLPNWISGFGNLVFFIPFYFFRVSEEEKMMTETFGKEYEEYVQKTGSIFPKLRF